ncbi:hypothetical protein MKC54_21760, partial [[Clostridium] innocuum]|nr:hypothetical protein [[Clostridium] innocuum]MCR0579523.1 hypothetical protein [[Clostridium] innocuum]
MKKLLALAMAAMMCAVAAPIHAADEATEVNPQTDENQNIESEADTQAAKGEVWAMLSSKTELDQMKVTVPIRLHFAVLNKKDGETNLQFKTPHTGKYAISVDKTSSVDVKVNSVKVEKPQNGKWTLADKDTVAAEKNDPRMVSISLMNQDMKQDEAINITDFTVKKNTSETIPFSGTASQAAIPSDSPNKVTGIYEKAFNVTYTLEMVTPPTTPTA